MELNKELEEAFNKLAFAANEIDLSLYGPDYDSCVYIIRSALERKEKLEKVWEIVKSNPEIVWWVCCYEDAYEMILDRKSFMLDYDMKEIERQFNLIKEMLKEK